MTTLIQKQQQQWAWLMQLRSEDLILTSDLRWGRGVGVRKSRNGTPLPACASCSDMPKRRGRRCPNELLVGDTLSVSENGDSIGERGAHLSFFSHAEEAIIGLAVALKEGICIYLAVPREHVT